MDVYSLSTASIQYSACSEASAARKPFGMGMLAAPIEVSTCRASLYMLAKAKLGMAPGADSTVLEVPSAIMA